jgi:hypothetical protein
LRERPLVKKLGPHLARLRDGAMLAALIACVAIAEQLGGAAKVAERLRDALRSGPDLPDWPEYGWIVMMVLSLVLGIGARRRVITEIRELRLEREAAGEQGPSPSDSERWFARLVSFAIILWLCWQIGAYGVYQGAWRRGFWWDAMHVSAMLSATASLAFAGLAIGDISRGARRASLVRIQLLVLAGLITAFFIVPITAAQVTDVLRAWGDGPWPRVTYGLATGVLLGLVVRASAEQILIPAPWRSERRERIARGALAVVVVVALLLLWAGACWRALTLVALFGGVIALAEWDDKCTEERDDTGDDQLRRLARSLGVVPSGILFAGLVSALTDSLLLPSEYTGQDGALTVAAVVAGVVVAALGAYAQPGDSFTTESHGGLAGAAGVGLVSGTLVLLANAGGSAALLAGTVFLVGGIGLTILQLGRRGVLELSAGAGAVVGTTVAVYGNPVGAPRALGAIGVGLLGVVAVLLALHVLGAIGQRLVVRRRVQSFLVGRKPQLPVIVLVGLWLVIAWSGAPPTQHQARVVDAERAPSSLDTELRAWLGRQPETGTAPMLLVSASGGGAKAAYWTALVMDCIGSDDSPDQYSEECPRGKGKRLDSLFLTSSVSGGSVGVYHFVRHRDAAVAGRDWVHAAVTEEVLSPIVAWGLFHDLPAFLVGLPIDPARCRPQTAWHVCPLHADRAVAQEAAVAGADWLEPAADEETVLEGRGGSGPVTVFNGAVDGADGRVLISPAALAPPRLDDCPTPWTGEPGAGSLDAHDLLNALKEESPAAGEPSVFKPQRPYKDIPLVTAAVLSARFPVVAPAARVGRGKAKKGKRGCRPDTLPSERVRDGGYVENSGLLTITELLPAIQAGVRDIAPDRDVPIVIVSADDDPVVTAGDPDLSRAAEASFGVKARSGPGYFTRLARDRLESCQYRGIHYARISPTPHVGAQAATGWEVSATARREDLVDSLSRAYRPLKSGIAHAPRRLDAGTVLQQVRDVLDGRAGLSCPAG